MNQRPFDNPKKTASTVPPKDQSNSVETITYYCNHCQGVRTKEHVFVPKKQTRPFCKECNNMVIAQIS